MPTLPGLGSHPLRLAFLFAALALPQLLYAWRRRHPAYHRNAGRVAIVCGLIATVNGALIPFAIVPLRSLLERLHIVIYFTGISSFLILSFLAARRRDNTLQRALKKAVPRFQAHWKATGTENKYRDVYTNCHTVCNYHS